MRALPIRFSETGNRFLPTVYTDASERARPICLRALPTSKVDVVMQFSRDAAVLEQRLFVGGGDNQHIRHLRQHQRGEGVEDHRLIVDREQLLADGLRDRVQSCAGSPSQNDATPVTFQWNFSLADVVARNSAESRHSAYPRCTISTSVYPL